MGYLQWAWTSVVGCGPSWPHGNGSSPPYCGWHSWHSSAASHRAWAVHMLEHRGHRCHRKFTWETGCGKAGGEMFETYSQRHWLPRCLSQPLPPLCSWWQTSWWPCPWGHNGHSWCSGWAARGRGPSWHDRYSSFSWSKKCTQQRQIIASLSNKTSLQIKKKSFTF